MAQHSETGWLEEMSKYAVVIEKSSNGFGAYAPDVPGCVAVGETLAETERLIREALDLHIAALREDGDPIPRPTTVVREVDVG